MFQILDGFLKALNDGEILRGTIARVLKILGWVRIVGAVLVVLMSFAGLANSTASFALGTILGGVGWGGFLFLGACLENFRARQIEALPNSPRMTSWIWVNLMRLAGEEALAFFAMFGVVTFSSVAFLGSNSYFSAMPGLGGLAFVAGLFAFVGCVIVGALAFVAFTIAADLVSASLESADTLRRIELMSVGRNLGSEGFTAVGR